MILEAMRLFPPAPLLSRIPKTDMQLGGMAITPRTWVGIPIFALHRNALLWDNPHAFDPDRFAPDQAKGRSRYAHLPFGAGPRVCIGANFAMINEQQRAQPYKAIDGLKNGHDRFATKVDPPQEVEQTKMITK